MPEQSPSIIRTRGKQLLRWVGTLFLGGYILFRIDVSALEATLADAHLVWLVIATLLYAGDRVIAGMKWQVLFNVDGHRISLSRAVSVYLKSSFLGAALPATVGTDLIRARMARDGSGGFAHSLSSVVVERLLGILALVFTAAVGIFFFGPAYLRTITLAVAIPLVVAGSAATILIFASLGSAIRRWFSRHTGRIVNFISTCVRRVRGYGDCRSAVGVAFLLAITQQYLLTFITWILGLALGVDLPLITMLWAWPLVLLAIRLPISMVGFGVREFLLIEFLDTAGIAAEQAVALGILSGLLDLLFIAFGGVLILSAGTSMLSSSAGWRAGIEKAISQVPRGK